MSNMPKEEIAMKHTKRIGLTGIMGAGKSSVIDLLLEFGIPVLDCDKINKELIRKGAKGYEQIIATFGKTLCDVQGELDAKAMSEHIFSNPSEKKRLEGILHPMIKEEIIQRCDACEAACIVVEVPLLFEVHWEEYFDEIWVVTCEQDVLLQRLEQFRHISKKEALKRLSYQMPQEEKCARADVVLHNDQDKAYLKMQIAKQLKRLEEEGFRAT